MQLDYNKILINTEIEDFDEIFSEPFYRIDIAIKMIKSNSYLSSYTKNILA